MQTTFEEVQRLVNRLTFLEKIRLLEYLIPIIARSATPIEETSDDVGVNILSKAWEEFFQIGEAIAAAEPSSSETLTSAVMTMRR